MTDPRSPLSFAEELQALADELLELDGTGEEARAAGPRLANRIERRMAEFLETRPDGVDHALARPAWVAAELLRETVDDWPTEGAATEQKLWEMRALLLAALVPTLDEVGLGLPRMGRWSSWHEAPRGDDDDSNTFSSRAGILSIAGFVDEPDEERARERREQLLAATRLTVRQLRRHVRDAPAVPPPAPSAEEPSEAAVGTARDDRLDQVDREDLTPESVETLQAVYELVGAWMRHKGERLFERHYTDRSLLDLRLFVDCDEDTRFMRRLARDTGWLQQGAQTVPRLAARNPEAPHTGSELLTRLTRAMCAQTIATAAGLSPFCSAGSSASSTSTEPK